MPGDFRVGCFTLSGLTVVPASGYTGYIGSRERITPMYEEKMVAAVERVAAHLCEGLRAEYRSPMGGVEVRSEWTGEDFYSVLLTTPAGSLSVVVTSVVGEEGADARVVVLDPEGGSCAARAREVHRVARVVAADPAVGDVWPDSAWPRTFLVSVRSEGADS
nr:MAG TPA: hypothetical protein [Caudoviricetes sp.]